MINHIFILFTSILPCFRYRTPRLVQAVTFCKKKKQNGSFIHNSLKRACLAAIGQGSEQRTSTTVTAMTEITQWSYLVLVSARNHWQINGQVSLQNKACFLGGRGRRGVCLVGHWIPELSTLGVLFEFSPGLIRKRTYCVQLTLTLGSVLIDIINECCARSGLLTSAAKQNNTTKSSNG